MPGLSPALLWQSPGSIDDNLLWATILFNAMKSNDHKFNTEYLNFSFLKYIEHKNNLTI